MKFKILIGILMVLSLVLVGCAPQECPVCETCEVCEECPVLECDTTPADCPETMCPACPVINETDEETTVFKYVCADGRIKDAADECTLKEVTEFTPVTTNEDDSLIEKMTVKPACLQDYHGANIYFKVGSIAKEINIQVKQTADEEFKTIHTAENKFEDYMEFSIVDKESQRTQSDFNILANSVYLMRLEFVIPAFDEIQYSNEHVIDTREGSDYNDGRCGVKEKVVEEPAE